MLAKTTKQKPNCDGINIFGLFASPIFIDTITTITEHAVCWQLNLLANDFDLIWLTDSAANAKNSLESWQSFFSSSLLYACAWIIYECVESKENGKEKKTNHQINHVYEKHQFHCSASWDNFFLSFRLRNQDIETLHSLSQQHILRNLYAIRFLIGHVKWRRHSISWRSVIIAIKNNESHLNFNITNVCYISKAHNVWEWLNADSKHRVEHIYKHIITLYTFCVRRHQFSPPPHIPCCCCLIPCCCCWCCFLCCTNTFYGLSHLQCGAYNI